MVDRVTLITILSPARAAPGTARTRQVCAQRGYPCVITMAESFSIERRKVMRALGAQVSEAKSTQYPVAG